MLKYDARLNSLLFFALYVCALVSHSAQETLPTTGNFALAQSQQPGPFFSFGQNIIDKGVVQIYASPDFLKVQQEHYLQWTPAMVWGITDNASLLVELPRAVDFQSGFLQSSGQADSLIQMEYNLYEVDNARYGTQWTIVGNITLPTGSLTKNPPTGYGSVSYFIGSTYNIMSPEWFFFVSAGYTNVTPHHDIRIGSQYLYQGGLGRNIMSESGRFIFFGLLELDGTYSNQSRIFDIGDSDSGGNVVMLTPSLWFATPKLFIQPGVSIPVVQTLNGEQHKVHYYASLAIGYTF